MRKYRITRTEVRRTLVSAPNRSAALIYSNSDAYAEYCATISPDTDDTVVETPTPTGADLTLNEDGEPVHD